ncbi:MAG: cation-translocating P-type ATPase, partial [Candidatus Hodarchaeales archaeon]
DEDRWEYFIDSIAISAIVLFNAFFGFIQEYKAEKSIEALKSMAAPYTTVVREGKRERIETKLLVPGDLIMIEEGDRIPADARLTQSLMLRVDESTLTGESFPVAKESSNLVSPSAVIGDRINSVFSGTSVTRGRGQAIIVETGMNTEFGKIARGLMLEETEETPLQKRLAVLGKWIGIGCIVICTVIFTLGVLLAQDMVEMFIVAVGLAVAAVPEGLPAVVTLALALGVQRMSNRNAIIRRLPSVETLGSTTVICSDKTGTLTKNEMTVRQILTTEAEYPVDDTIIVNEPIEKILTISLECNNAQLSDKSDDDLRTIDIGDPTEIALLKLANELNFSSNFERMYEIPFDSDSKRMSVVVKNPEDEFFVLTKGAPDVLINLCDSYFYKGDIKQFSRDDRKSLEKSVQKLAETGYRMLGMAYKSLKPEKAEIKVLSEDIEQIETNLIYLGAVAIMDPPRDGTRNAIEICKTAGIRIIMITGDHRKTAVAVASEIGLISDAKLAITIEGAQLSNIDDEELTKVVAGTQVFARVSPEHKLRLVKALKSNNEIVAMTGDGVNDAPALKKADIGIAMGISGTDVSKEASDMVLADDDFSTIVGAILEGRTIYDNMRKFILYLLSCNAGEVSVMFFGIILTTWLYGEPFIPLIAIQILWVNLVTDGLPALAMGVDPPDPDVMSRTPRDSNEPILTRKSIYFIIYSGIIISIGTLFIFFLYINLGISVIVFQMIMALNIRKEEHSLLGKEFLRNPYLLLAITSSLLLHIAVVYIPFLQPFFHTTSLDLIDWVLIITIGSILIIIDEARTFIAHRFPKFRKLAGYW